MCYCQVDGGEGVYECAICGAQFPGMNLLGQHCEVHMREAEEGERGQKEGERLQEEGERLQEEVGEHDLKSHGAESDGREKKQFKSLKIYMFCSLLQLSLR